MRVGVRRRFGRREARVFGRKRFGFSKQTKQQHTQLATHQSLFLLPTCLAFLQQSLESSHINRYFANANNSQLLFSQRTRLASWQRRPTLHW